jgi:RHS repeat-associated protein
METFVVNETPEDVWFDNMMVMSMSSPIAQETHYDPWGLELTGIGFQYGGIKANKYLYNGIELIEDNGLNIYSALYRNYDPVIGRWWQNDPKTSERESPYVGMGNNPILYSDFLGDTIRFNGSEVFVKQFETDKAKIGESKEGQALLKLLDDSPSDIYVSEATTLTDDILTFFGLEGDTDENNLKSSKTTQNARGTVNLEYSQVEGVEISGAISESHHTLNHELNHAKDFVNGTTAKELTKDNNGKTAIVNGETRAVESTNRIRAREGKPLRTEYNFSNGKVIKFKTP